MNVPWVSMILCRIFFKYFLVTRKLISGTRKFSGLLLSTKPRSWGRISLKRRRPSVVSTMPVMTSPFAFFLLILTRILLWRVM